MLTDKYLSHENRETDFTRSNREHGKAAEDRREHVLCAERETVRAVVDAPGAFGEELEAHPRADTYLKEVYAGLPVWEVAKAKLSRTMTVENYLMSVMTPYFDEKGEVRDFEGIPLSEGGLVPPSGLRAEYAGGVVTLRWNVGEDEARARHADTLQAVWVREARAGHVGRVAPAALAGEADGSGSHPAARAGSAEEDGARAATRGDGAASFAVGLNPGDRLHIYPFFAAEDMSDFSRNGHIVVEINDEG